MVMDVIQVRLPKGIIKQIDGLVSGGDYASRSDVVRDAVRKKISADLEKQIGSIPNTGNSVKEVKKIRKILSRQKVSLNEINELGK